MAKENGKTTETKAVGIIGGMGPMATVDLFRKIVMMTDASSDSEHLRIMIDNRPEIPDRTAAILAGKDTPVSYILDSASRLAAMGADFLIIPCNTSHCFFPAILEGSPIPVLNMIEETALRLQADGVKSVGLLATDGVLQVGVYDQVLAEHGIRTLRPSPARQKEVMHIIYGEIKAGVSAHPEALEPLLGDMMLEGAEAFILGCTELPLAFDGYTVGRERFYDPTAILAAAAIKYAGGAVRHGEYMHPEIRPSASAAVL